MKKLIALVAATGALLVGGMASAAPVDLIFTRTAPLASTWTLSMVVNDPISIVAVAFNIQSSPVADFVITAPITSVDAFSPTGFSVKGVNLPAPGNLHIVLNVGTGGQIVPGVLGTLTATGLSQCDNAGCTFFGNGDLDGGTVQDLDFAPVEYSVHFVPEPTMMVLLGLGLAGLGLVRRSA